jgi:hypothetical protein
MGRTACTEPQCLYKSALYHIFTTRFSCNSEFACAVNSILNIAEFYRLLWFNDENLYMQLQKYH